jgi:nucleotide-binding universal stress UspA family protein
VELENSMSAKKTTDRLITAPYILVGLPAQDHFHVSAALSYATALAASNGTGLSVHIFSPPVASPFPITTDAAFDWPTWENSREESLITSTAAAAAEFIGRSGVKLIDADARSSGERKRIPFLHLARLHDLTVLDATGSNVMSVRSAIEDALFDSGSPVLLVPSNCEPFPPRCIVIAWDGSAQSARAVKDSLPLLGAAEIVIAVTVTGEKKVSKTAPGVHLVSYLARHGIDCKFVTLDGQEGDAAEHLHRFVAEQSADLLVMGAFVHSRWREAVVGGVTQSFMDDCPLPLFMAH